MKRPIAMGYGLALGAALLFGFGCALTNYELITDRDGNIVNTKGNAYIRGQFGQIATVWPDGYDNLIWYVDQKSNGDRKLSTVNYFTTGTEDQFKDDLYCSPDWSGCKVVTADDPEIGDVDEFDYTVNPQCDGYRSLRLALLISSTRYYGECGRTRNGDRSLKMLALANSLTPVEIDGAMWLRGNLSALNSSLVLNNRNGGTYAVPITSEIGITANFAKRRMLVDMTNPNNRTLAESVINWNATHPGPELEATITVNGIEFVFHTKLMKSAGSWPKLHY
jgi:hypothetical protein